MCIDKGTDSFPESRLIGGRRVSLHRTYNIFIYFIFRAFIREKNVTDMTVLHYRPKVTLKLSQTSESTAFL